MVVCCFRCAQSLQQPLPELRGGLCAADLSSNDARCNRFLFGVILFPARPVTNLCGTMVVTTFSGHRTPSFGTKD